jgi:hypothetical protein
VTTTDSEILTLAYFSSSKIAWTESDLTELLRISRVNNQKVDVSGFLIFADGSFLQWLEGPAEGLEYIFTKISQDKRHSQLSLIYKGSLGDRYFSKWSMAFIPQVEIDDDLHSNFMDLRALRTGGGFLENAPRLARRIADNFLRFNRF